MKNGGGEVQASESVHRPKNSSQCVRMAADSGASTDAIWSYPRTATDLGGQQVTGSTELGRDIFDP